MAEIPWDDLSQPLLLREELDEAGDQPWRLTHLLATTYGVPEQGLLTDLLLPAWLGLSPYRQGDSDIHQYRRDLEQALCQVEGLIISDAQPTGWLWRLLPCARVGMQTRRIGRIAQHAKLWLLAFQRQRPDGTQAQAVEVCVSSANLTWSGMRGQSQAVWRCAAVLADRQSARSRRLSNQLIGFLKAMEGDIHQPFAGRLQGWHGRLHRMEWPDDLDGFVMSVPGNHRHSHWGAATWSAARGVRPTAVRILTPSLGDWSEHAAPGAVRAWGRALGVAPQDIAVVRPARRGDRTDRVLGRMSAWEAPEHILHDLWSRGIARHRLPIDHPLLCGSNSGDPRWFHGKLYETIDRQGRVIQRYLGSANFSPAAWGSVRGARTHITNYELGVLLRIDSKGHRQPWIGCEPCDAFDRQLTCDEARPCEEAAPTPWSSWTWDGRWLVAAVTAQAAYAGQRVACQVRFADGTSRRIILRLSERPTGCVTRRWSCAKEIVGVDIAWPGSDGEHIVPFDSRPAETIYGEIAARAMQADDGAYVDGLLKRYGGWGDDALDAEQQSEGPDERSAERMIGTGRADYQQQWMVLARQLGRVIDGWRETVDAVDDKSLRFLLSDADAMVRGMRDRARAQRQGHPLAAMVWAGMADELQSWVRSVR